MATHKQIEAWWSDRRCKGPHVSLDMNGRFPVRLQPELEVAGLWMADAIMANGYRSPMGPTGSYNCRTIGGSNTWSLHAYAVAVDWDYGENPYLRGTRIQPGFGTDPRFMLTEAQVNAVEGIVNDDGDSIWRWLGWTIGDTMHFQVDVPPDKCAPAGTQPVPPPIGDDDMEAYIRAQQQNLNVAGFTDAEGNQLVVDGIYGSKTQFAQLTRDIAAADVGGDHHHVTGGPLN